MPPWVYAADVPLSWRERDRKAEGLAKMADAMHPALSVARGLLDAREVSPAGRWRVRCEGKGRASAWTAASRSSG